MSAEICYVDQLVGNRAELRSAWETRPYVHRGCGAFEPSVDLDTLMGLVDSGMFPAALFRVIGAFHEVDPSDYVVELRGRGRSRDSQVVSPRRARALYDAGLTLVLSEFDRVHAPTATMMRRFAQELGHELDIVAFLSPPNGEGSRLHYDLDSSIIRQLSGSKRWRLYDPLEASTITPFEDRLVERIEEMCSLQLETSLHSGDAMYLPRGTPHKVDSTDEHSLHVSVGFKCQTWATVLSRLLQKSAPEIPALRESLPYNYRNEPHSLLRGIHDRLSALTAESLLSSLPPRDEVPGASGAPRLEQSVDR